MKGQPINLKSTWSTLEESSRILFDNYGYPAADKVAEELSLPPGYYAWVTVIWLFDANPFSIAQLMRYFPYGLTRVNDERLTSAVQRGYFASDGQGKYRATEMGRTVALRLIQAGNNDMAALTPMPKESLRTLGNLLDRISDAALNSPEPPAHVLIKAKRDLYQRTGTFASLEGFPAHCLLLEGHRDDCYYATWSQHELEGHTWEVLDSLSRGESMTFDELHENTSGRGVTREAHMGDVKELTRRGWVDEDSGVVQITLTGNQVRAEVEVETERLFFLPWSCLTISELEDLARLTVDLYNGLGLLQKKR